MSQKDKDNTPMAVLVNCAKCPRPVYNIPAWQEVPEKLPREDQDSHYKKSYGKMLQSEVS